MSNDEKSPTWKPGDLAPLESAKVKLTSAGPRATGESKYGTWNLWVAHVENQKVHNRDTNSAVEGYTGEVVFFPSEKLHEQLMNLSGNGTKADVEIEITMVPKKSAKGSLYTTYEAKLVKEGVIPPSSVVYDHSKFITDFKYFVGTKVFMETEEHFIKCGERDPYNLKNETLKDLWQTYKVQNSIE